MNKPKLMVAVTAAIVTLVVIVVTFRGRSSDETAPSPDPAPTVNPDPGEPQAPGTDTTGQPQEPVEPHSEHEPDHPDDDFRAIVQWTNLMASLIDKDEAFALINASSGSKLDPSTISEVVGIARDVTVADVTGTGRERYPALYPPDVTTASPVRYCCPTIEFYAVGADIGDTPGSALALIAWHGTSYDGEYVDGVFFLELVDTGDGWSPTRFVPQPTQ